MAKQDYGTMAYYGLSALNEYYSGRIKAAQGSYRQSQFRQQARDTIISGERASSRVRAAGARTIADAKMAMVAQGGTVDNVTLAKMKSQSSADAISTMYDAKADAHKADMEARMEGIAKKYAMRKAVVGMGANLLAMKNTYKP